jgi:fructose-1,6-bisphosphatase I
MHITNLTSHLLSSHGHTADARDLAAIINQIVFASKIISREINKAGLAEDILGSTGKTNIQDEEVQKLDEFANDLMIKLLSDMPRVRALGSEELDQMIDLEQHKSTGKYIVLMDPLDGSSNIDVNVSVGTIFVIFKKQSKGSAFTKADYLQTGEQAVAAGYILYGSSTMLVYSTGYGVHGFTLDSSIGEFLLSHPHIKIPQTGQTYSVNEAHLPLWDDFYQDYLAEVKTDSDISGQAKMARYIGTLVADAHRNLLTGGVYLYPGNKKNPNGKLRLMFEAIPFAFLHHHAGGAATDGARDIMKIKPSELHQRVPLFVGSFQDVGRLTRQSDDNLDHK